MNLTIHLFIILVLLLAWLGLLMIIVGLAGLMEKRPARHKPCRNRYHPRLVTIKPAITPDLPASQSPIPTERGLYIDEIMYDFVDRFDDPEGDL